MASSSIRRLISDKAAAGSCLFRPRISLSQNRGCSKLSTAAGDSVLRRASYSSPWLMLPPSFEKGGGGGMSYNFYSLAQSKVVSFKKKSESSESPDDDAFFAGSSHGWVALHNQRGDRDLFLSNPITGDIIKLPPLSTVLDEDYDCDACFVRKVILSSPPHQPDCRAMMSFYGSLYVCSPGRSSEWKDAIEWQTYEDFVYSTKKKLFLCLFEHDRLEGWDATDPLYPNDTFCESFYGFDYDDENYRFSARSDQEYENKLRCRSFRTRYFIHVEHTDQLLLVNRHFAEQLAPDGSPVQQKEEVYGFPSKDLDNDVYPSKTIGFDVHVIDLSCKNMRYMEDSLDGLVLFVGINHSFAVAAAEFPELKPDSIYFTECETYSCPTACSEEMHGGHDIGIFDYKERTILPCYYPCDYGSLKKIYPSPFWFTPSPH